MDQPPTLRQPYATEGATRKNGCLFWCLGIFVGLPVLLVVIGYYVLMHTAVPLQFVAKALNQDKNIKIEGIGGSISRGFTIDSIRSIDASGNESVLEGVALQWGDITRMSKNSELVIEKIGLRRAHIYINSADYTSGTPSSGSTAPTSPASSSATPSSGGGTRSNLNLFEIKSVDIREVVVESTTGDFKLDLDEVLMKGFRIQNNQFDLAALSVGSNFLDLHLEDAATETIAGQQVPFTRRIIGLLKPQMHKSLAREIDFTVDLGAVGGQMVSRVRGFKGAMETINLGPIGYEAVTLKDFTPADYFAPDSCGPVSKLSMEIRPVPEAEATGADPRPSQIESGSLTLGTTPFAMAPQKLEKESTTAGKDSHPIVATRQLDGLSVTATLRESQEIPFYHVQLESTPPRDTRDLVALLWFGKPYADLTPDQATAADTTSKLILPPGK